MSGAASDTTQDAQGDLLSVSSYIDGAGNLSVTGAFEYSQANGGGRLTFNYGPSALPAADAAQTKYAALQLNADGSTTMLTNLGSPPAVAGPLSTPIWQLAIPANETVAQDPSLAQTTPDLQ